MTCCTKARPARRCNTLGKRLFMRVPLPAAMMTTSTAVMNFPSLLMTTASRLGRIIGLLALATALAGCSAIKLGYNNLDHLAYWWLDSYVDFSGEQGTQVRENLAQLHQWHRTEEL